METGAVTVTGVPGTVTNTVVGRQISVETGEMTGGAGIIGMMGLVDVGTGVEIDDVTGGGGG